MRHFEKKRKCWAKIGSDKVWINSDGYVEFGLRIWDETEYTVWPYRKFYRIAEDGSRKFKYASAAYLTYDYCRKLYSKGMLEFQ